MALTAKKVYDEIGLPCYVKTSGSTGIHVCVPLGAKYDFDTVRNLAELVAMRINSLLPDITSIERSRRVIRARRRPATSARSSPTRAQAGAGPSRDVDTTARTANSETTPRPT